MRKLATIAAALLISISMSGQNDISKMMGKVESNRISTDFKCVVVQNELPVTYSGHALVQQNCFILKGNGIEVYCDGKTLCYCDPKTKEAYLEDAKALEDYIWNNINGVKSFDVSNTEYLPMSPAEEDFKIPEFGKDWIVTDLR